jgi:hypothetical protein
LAPFRVSAAAAVTVLWIASIDPLAQGGQLTTRLRPVGVGSSMISGWRPSPGDENPPQVPSKKELEVSPAAEYPSNPVLVPSRLAPGEPQAADAAKFSVVLTAGLPMVWRNRVSRMGQTKL